MAIKKKIEEQEKQAGLVDFQVIERPFITEKAATVGGDNYSGVVLKVAKKATKDQIKQAVEKVFDVEVASVRTCNYIGKVKRAGRELGRRAAYKKAYISLQPGFEIDLYEGI